MLFHVEMEVSGASKIVNRYLNIVYRSQSFSVSFLELSAHFTKYSQIRVLLPSGVALDWT